ncbi:MAG: hypothetical protein RLZZ516_283 [Cyanobacteriota bacterium]|jgi:GNAT superfamily N-acetyltransferase
MKVLRPLDYGDVQAALEIYRQAVERCPAELYSDLQRHAWAAQAVDRAGADRLRASLEHGQGLVSCLNDGTVVAFALREPADRIALLYCHPSHQRQGHGTALLRALSEQAELEGQTGLRTEASFVSCGLFMREGWQHCWREELLINGVRFRRFRLRKPLQPILGPWPKHNCSSSSTRSVNSMPSSP